MPSRKPTFVPRLIHAAREVCRMHRDHRLLSAMSERELHDLGIGRSEIPRLLSDAEVRPNARHSRGPCAADARPATRP